MLVFDYQCSPQDPYRSAGPLLQVEPLDLHRGDNSLMARADPQIPMGSAGSWMLIVYGSLDSQLHFRSFRFNVALHLCLICMNSWCLFPSLHLSQCADGSGRRTRPAGQGSHCSPQTGQPQSQEDLRRWEEPQCCCHVSSRRVEGGVVASEKSSLVAHKRLPFSCVYWIVKENWFHWCLNS